MNLARSNTKLERLILSLRMRQLQLLSTLADTGNMRATGQRLNMSTSAVSKSLREAEDLFGQPIFRRLTQGLVVTPAGDLIVQRARHLLLELSQLTDDLLSTGEGAREQLVIGAPPFISWTWLPQLLSLMKEVASQTSIRIIEGRLAEMTRQFDAGDIDVLVTMDSPSELGGLKPGGYMLEPVGSEQWLVVGSPSNVGRLCECPSTAVSWSQLHDLDWILPPRPTNARMMVETMMQRQKLAPIVPRYETLNAITNVNLAKNGLGLTVLTEGVVRDHLQGGTLVQVPLAEPFAPTTIVLVYRHSEATRRGVSSMRLAAQRLYREAASSRSNPSASRNALFDLKSQS